MSVVDAQRSAADAGPARRWSYLLACLTLLGGLSQPLFRATLYRRLPVAPGEPYGLGDVLELALAALGWGGALLVGLVGVVVLAAGRRPRREGLVLVAAAPLALILQRVGMEIAARAG